MSVCSSKESDHQAALYDSTRILKAYGQSRTLKLFFGFFPWPTDRDSNSRHSRVQQALSTRTQTNVVMAHHKRTSDWRHEKPTGERVGGVLRTLARGVFIRHTAPGDELRVPACTPHRSLQCRCPHSSPPATRPAALGTLPRLTWLLPLHSVTKHEKNPQLTLASFADMSAVSKVSTLRLMVHQNCFMSSS